MGNSQFKTNQPGVNLAVADTIGPRGMTDNDRSSGFREAIEELQKGQGINHIVQVNDCATAADWTESDNGTFDVAADTTYDRLTTKNSAVSFTNTAATDNSQYCQTLIIDESKYASKNTYGKRQMNWEDTDYIGFWKTPENSAENGTAGEMSFAIVNDGTLSAKTNIAGNSTTAVSFEQIDISGLDRDKVEAIRFYSNNSVTGEATIIDEIIRYKYQFNGGPLYGQYFYITSAGTLTENQNARWTIDGLAVGDATEVVNDVGPCQLGAATATGTAARNVWGRFPGQFIFLAKASAATVAGEGLIFSGAATLEGCSTGVEEISICKGLEAAAYAGDSIFCIYQVGGTFIS